MKKIQINKQTRKHAMCAMNNMDIYMNNADPFVRVPAYEMLKHSLRSLSTITGLDYEELYETLTGTDLSNYNLTWLRCLMFKQMEKQTGKKRYGKYHTKLEKDYA